MDFATNSVFAMALELLPSLAVGTEVSPVTVRAFVVTSVARASFIVVTSVARASVSFFVA